MNRLECTCTEDSLPCVACRDSSEDVPMADRVEEARMEFERQIVAHSVMVQWGGSTTEENIRPLNDAYAALEAAIAERATAPLAKALEALLGEDASADNREAHVDHKKRHLPPERCPWCLANAALAAHKEGR